MNLSDFVVITFPNSTKSANDHEIDRMIDEAMN